MARAIQIDAPRTHPLFAWIVIRDLPEYPGAFVARLVADTRHHIYWSDIPWLRTRPGCRKAWNALIVSRQTRRTWWRCGFPG